MKIQYINNVSQSFGALNLSAEARALIEQERGGKAAIKRFTKELENSRWDLNIKTTPEFLDSYFGEDRVYCIIPSKVQDEYVMVHTFNAHTIADELIIDCLKFSSKQRAKEVYDTLMKHYLVDDSDRTPLKDFKWDVDAMKAYTEAEIVPQKESPWANLLTK